MDAPKRDHDGSNDEGANKRIKTTEGDFEALLSQYYQRLYPFQKVARWLGAGEGFSLSHREFSFTLKDDVYLRYRSFASEKEFRDDVISLNPYKIDIGAVFTVKPKDHKAVKPGAFVPVAKDLVFDIDLTDYDDVRTCCSEANICQKCWRLMAFAIRIIDKALREDFGFEHLLWVYSGRRGVHCWVSDARARNLSQDARSAIAEYFTLVKGGEQQTKKVKFVSESHPAVQRACEIISSDFVEAIVEDQDILGTEERCAKVLALVSDKNVQDSLQERWRKNPHAGSKKRWEELSATLLDPHQKTIKRGAGQLREIQLQYSYPRLDGHVTKQTNHLLKGPFCVHPKTGRVCVPIDPLDPESFDPEAVPTLQALVSEIDAFHHEAAQDASAGAKLSDYKKTSLKGHIDFLEGFVKNLERSCRAEADPMSF